MMLMVLFSLHSFKIFQSFSQVFQFWPPSILINEAFIGFMLLDSFIWSKIKNYINFHHLLLWPPNILYFKSCELYWLAIKKITTGLHNIITLV